MTTAGQPTALADMPIAEAAALAQAATSPFTDTRYPIKYAIDFARGNPEVVGVDPDDHEAAGSRGIMSGHLRAYMQRTGQNPQDVYVALADGYLSKYGIIVSQDRKDAAVAASRHAYWKSYGLDEQPAA